MTTDCPHCPAGELHAVDGVVMCTECSAAFYAGQDIEDVLAILEDVVDPHAAAEIDPNYSDVERAEELLASILEGGERE